MFYFQLRFLQKLNIISVENSSTIIVIIIMIIILSPAEVSPNLEQHLRREQQHHRLPRPHRHHVHLHGDASQAGLEMGTVVMVIGGGGDDEHVCDAMRAIVSLPIVAIDIISIKSRFYQYD